MLEIYLVEDSEIVRENLTDTLTELIAARIVGSSGSESSAITDLTSSAYRWNLAIVDIFLTPGNGLNVLAQVNSRRPEQKVVVLTNYATVEVRRECMRLGADAVFDKSKDIDALIAFCETLR